MHTSAQDVLCVCGVHTNALRGCTGCIVGWTVMHHVFAWGLLQGCTVVYCVFVCTGYTECRSGTLRVCMGFITGMYCSVLCVCVSRVY